VKRTVPGPHIRIVCISDTHELHRELAVPNGDLLIHAGDFTFLSKRPSMLRDFDKWLGELPHRYKVVIPGNHDYVLEDPQQHWQISNATLLVDSGIEVEEIKIWGSPVTPLYGGAFGKSNAADRKRHWAQIPEGTDILITHGPPFGILDGAPGGNIHEGDPELWEAVLRVRPRLHVFGHVHAGYGTRPAKSTLFVNAALFEDGELSKRPIVLAFSRK
jgi:Icc-related predicted phosphoesterase